jgi:HlyD family secretion protein
MKNKKKLYIIIIVFIIIIGLAIYLIKRTGTKAYSYKLYKIKPITIQKYVLTTGTINPVHTINVGAQVSGEIYKLDVWYNTNVKKGQLLAEIDPSTFIARVDMDKANLLSAEANVSKQVALLNYDKLTYIRNKKLWAENLISHSTEQNAESVYLQDAAQLKFLDGIVKADQSQLSIDETNLSYTKIYSPVNGIVINVNVAVGQTVASSFQTPTLFTIGENISKMEIDTTTNEADLGGIKKGNKVAFTVYAYPGKTFYGNVHNVRINPTVVSGVVSYDVTIFFNNNDHLLLPGMTAIPKIYIEKKTGVVAVPNTALRFIPANENKDIINKITNELKTGEGVVWISQNNKPVPVIVKLSINNNSYTEVISNKIKIGSEVITGLNSSNNVQNKQPQRPKRKMFF